MDAMEVEGAETEGSVPPLPRGPSTPLRNADSSEEAYVAMMPEPGEDEQVWGPPSSFPLSVKKFNPVFFWSWDVHSDNCAICRVMLMEPCLNCQVNNKTSCIVVWGECNHAFHNCCMSAWMKNASHAGSGAASKCPLCQSEWLIQRIGN
ncbi:RING-box protein 2-like [Paramacrobiotus metropolitanus]|uniref:RING-box protein 2-like n=1 Tax=Paramacrobiotus metropolitanus TaxID=2943436 RepID=UPI0024457203|nr:RING-box protein 2-like [Paramacrobiotus metropolitanus]